MKMFSSLTFLLIEHSPQFIQPAKMSTPRDPCEAQCDMSTPRDPREAQSDMSTPRDTRGAQGETSTPRDTRGITNVTGMLTVFSYAALYTMSY
jgi:hypothetical protein